MNRIEFVQKHLKAFRKSIDGGEHPDNAGGKNARSFAEGLQGVEAKALCDGKIKRGQAFDLAADSAVNTKTVCAAIMAWGGMRPNHAKLVFERDSQEWVEAADCIRQGKLDRKAAYEKLSSLRRADKLRGMGPAYFTKVIYFLMPRSGGCSPRGYIMDQWAGCSINLLASRNVVLMNTNIIWKPSENGPVRSSSCTVSDVNTSDHYEVFCTHIDELAKTINRDGDQTDRALVSIGGKKAAPWRRYVIENRKT